MLDNPNACGVAVRDFLLPLLSHGDAEVACSR
jgi:hypothetical protein